MFEGIVASVLERLLGQYVEGLDRASLKVAVWSGDVTLTDVMLKREACYALGLPVNIKSGSISKISVKIPWSKLGSEPVCITLDGVFLVSGPLDEGNLSDSARREWAWARKLQQLEAYLPGLLQQLAKGSPGAGGAPTQEEAKAGGADNLSLVSKVVHNIQLSLRDIHLRFEDARHSTLPFAAGVTLSELSATTTDSRGNTAFSVDAKLQLKKLHVRELAVYHECGCRKMYQASLTQQETAAWLRSMLPRHSGTGASTGAQSSLEESYLIKPVSCNARLAMRPAAVALQGNQPQVDVQVSLRAVAIRLSEQQLRDVARLTEYMNGVLASGADADAAKASLGELKHAALPADPRGRWILAFECVRAESRRLRGWRLHTPGFFEARRTARLKYVSLFKRAQRRKWLKPLTPDEELELRRMERDELQVEDIVQFRAFAHVQLQAEDVHYSSVETAPKQEKSTWMGWLMGRSTQTVPQFVDVGVEIELNAEQRETLASFLAGNDDSSSESLANASSEYVQYSLNVSLELLSFALVQPFAEAPPDLEQRIHLEELATLSLSGFRLGIAKRVAGMSAKGSLDAMELLDCSVPQGSIGRNIVTPARSSSSTVDDAGGLPAPQWQFSFIQSPSGRSEAYAVEIRISSPLEIIHKARLLRRVSEFFAVVGETERAELAHLVTESAQQAFRHLTEETLSAIQARRTTFALSMKLAAPRLILAEDLSDPHTSLLILDMGDIHVASVPQPKAEDVQAGDLEKAAAYNRYNVEISSMQILLTPAHLDWRSHHVQLEQRLNIVYQFGLQLECLTCILPSNAHNMDELIVHGSLSEKSSPSINLRLSSEQCLKAMTIFRANREEQLESHPQGVAQPKEDEASTALATADTQAPLRVRATMKLQSIMLMLADAPDGKERELAMLRTSDISLEVSQNSNGTQASFVLGSLMLDDRTERPGDGESNFHILNSNPDLSCFGVSKAPTTPGEGNTHLVRMLYKSDTEGLQSELELHFNRLHVEWNADTIASLLTLARTPFADDDVVEEEFQDAVEEVDVSAAAHAAEGTLKVRAYLQSLSVSLNEEGTDARLALLGMEGLEAHVTFAGGGMTVSGQLGNLTAQDTYTAPSTPYEMLGLRSAEEHSLLTFEYEAPSEAVRAVARAAMKYDSSVRVRMSSVQLSYWHPAVMRTVNYMLEGVLGALMSATANTVAHMARSMMGSPEVSAMSLDVVVESPLVNLPTVAGGTDGFSADLGRLSVHNTLEHRAAAQSKLASAAGLEGEASLDCWSVTIEQMHLHARRSEESAITLEEAELLSDMAFDVTVERGVGASAGRALVVSATGGDLTCRCSKAQYVLLMRVFSLNLAGAGDQHTVQLQQSARERPNTHASPAPLPRETAGASFTHAIVPETAATMLVRLNLPLVTLELRNEDALSEGGLARIDMRSYAIEYTNSRGGVQVALALDALRADDLLHGGTELVKTVHGSTTESAQFVHLEYSRNFDGTESELELHFSRLHVEWNADTIASLLTLARTPFADDDVVEEEFQDAVEEVDASAAAHAAEGTLKVRAYLQSLSVSLNEEGTDARLALLGMEGLEAHVTFAGGGMSVSGQLGNLTAQDTYTAPSTPYEMLGLRSAEEHSLLTFEYEAPSEAVRAVARAAMKYDSSVRVRMSSVQLSYWHPAVMRTVNYMLEGVLGALMSATANTVAHMARSMMGSPEVSAMSLDVVVESPLVNLPTVVGGTDGFSADLGRLSVHNTLEHRAAAQSKLASAAGLEGEASLDCWSVTIEQMHLHARRSEESAITLEEAELLSDMAFDVTVERGVGASAGRALVVSATGGDLTCRCSKAQYVLLMRVFSLNLAGAGDRHTAQDDGVRVQADQQPDDDGVSAEAAEIAFLEENPTLTMNLKFNLGSAALQLDDEDGSLVSIALRRLGVDYKQNGNSGSEIECSCGAVEMCNARKGAGMRALLCADANLPQAPKDESAPLSPPQVQFIYSNELPSGNRVIVANVHGTKILLVPVVFESVHAFFVAGGDASKITQQDHDGVSPSPPSPSRATAYAMSSAMLSPLETGRRKVQSHVTSTPRSTASGGTLQVRLWLDASELVLPKDADKLDGESIALRGALCAKYHDSHGHDQLDLEVMQLQLKVIHECVASTVLAPTSLSTKISRGPSHTGSKVEMSLMIDEQVDCCISYKDCKLAADIAFELRGAAASGDTVDDAPSICVGGRVDEMDVESFTMKELRTIIKAAGLAMEDCIERGDVKARAREAQQRIKDQGVTLLYSEISEDHDLIVRNPTQPQVSCAVQVEGFRLVLINDLNGRTAPLVSTMIRPLAFMGSGTSAHFELGGEVGINIDMRNANMSLWEPLLEPFNFELTASMINGKDKLNDVKFEAKKPMNLNLSSDMCVLLSSTVITLFEDVTGSAKVGVGEEVYTPFNICNEIGLVLRYGRSRAGPPEALLLPAERQAFNFWPELDDRLLLCDPKGPPPTSLCLAIDGWNQVHDVPIDRVGKQLVDLHSPQNAGVRARIICETTLVNDERRVRIMSTTQLRNQTRELLCVRIGRPNQQADSIHPLAPGETLPMPPQHGSFAYRVCLRPMDGDYDWSSQCSIPSDDGSVQPAGSASFRCPLMSHASHAWHCVMHHEGRKHGICEVRILPSMMLTNLLSSTLHFELTDPKSSACTSWTVKSGDTLPLHAFVANAALYLSVHVKGYGPSQNLLVSVPAPTDESNTIKRSLHVFDRYRNTLSISACSERLQSSVHRLSLWAPYWVINNTGLPLLIRQVGATHGFTGDEPTVVREIVCENQRRPTAFHNFSAKNLYPTDVHGPFSDEHMKRKYMNLSSVWLPPGWIWLDDKWELERSATDSDHAGWQYGVGWTTGWSAEANALAIVRRRRWARNRIRPSAMNQAALATMTDGAIDHLGFEDLQVLLNTVGCSTEQVAELADLRHLCRRARDAARHKQAENGSSLAEGVATPVMPPVQEKNDLEVQLPSSRWSPPVNLEAVGTHALLELQPLPHGQPRSGSYQLGISIHACPGQFGRSKMLTISHRVVLCNQLTQPIAYKQHNSSFIGQLLRPGEKAPFHWQQANIARLLSISLVRAGITKDEALSSCDWSCAFPIEEVGDMTIVSRMQNSREKVFILVDVQVSGSEIKVIFAAQDAALAPYRIDNMSNHALIVSQSPCHELQHPRVIEEIHPGVQLPFAWEQVVNRPQLDLHVAGQRLRLCLDDLQLSQTFNVHAADGRVERLRYRMLMDGPVKVLQVMHAMGQRQGSSKFDDDGRLRRKLKVSFGLVGLSLIDKTPRELLYFTAAGVSLAINESAVRSSVHLTVQRLQVDNQLAGATFPVMLCPSWSEEESALNSRPPTVELLLQRNSAAPGVYFFETVSLRIQTLRLLVDTILVREFLLFFWLLYADITHLLASLLHSLGYHYEESTVRKTQKIYLRWLNIQPLRLIISCRSVYGGKMLDSLTEGVPAGAIGLLNSAGALLANIDKMPLLLKALVLDNCFAPVDVLASLVGASYKEQILAQLYKVVLSIDLLGNPRNFWNHMATGVTDAFYEPLNGILEGPEEFAQGVLRGGKSLTTNVVLGVTGSIGKIAGSMAKGVAELTLDQAYLAKRAPTSSPRSLEQGMVAGAEGFGRAFKSGLSGFVSKPLEGARKGGFEGLAKGFAQGTVGLLVKPMVGLADGISSASEGLTSYATETKHEERQRLPRALGPAGELTPFSEMSARMQQLLVTLDNNRSGGTSRGRFCGHAFCGGPADFGTKVVLTTTSHIIAVALNTGSSGGGGNSIQWTERLPFVAAVEATPNEVVLHLRDGGMHFIACSHPHARQELFSLLNKAVTGISS